MTHKNWHKRQHKSTPNQIGAVLLFALLIMSSVVIGSIGLGTIILDMLQQTRISDGAVLAYYAAESGVEEAIYNARKTGNIPPSYDADDARLLANQSKWWGDITGTTEIVYTDIDSYGFEEVNLFNPDAPSDFGQSNITRIEVAWSDLCGGCSVLRAYLVKWAHGGQVVWEEDSARYENTFEFVGGTANLSLTPNTLYKLRLRAKDQPLENVEIRAYDAANNPQPLPGQVVIDFMGRFSNSSRRLIATMPRGAPLSGIFDFVLFSECSLVKGRPVSCP